MGLVVILTEDQVELAISEASDAFSNFTDWATNNEKNEYYDGFAIWGELDYYADVTEDTGIRFFVTFTRKDMGWTGDLTTGQPLYYWSSADMGDAIIVGTRTEDTLGEAIRALKARMRMLFTALAGET